MKRQLFRARALTCALALMCGLTYFSTYGGDVKPLKGWAYSTLREYTDVVPDDPYFNAIVEEMGAPMQVVELTGIHFNNAMGRCNDQNVELDYLVYDDQLGDFVIQFYVKGIVTAPNGDTVDYIDEGVAYIGEDPVVFTYSGIITGGSGRFEGAEGAFEGGGVSEWPFFSEAEGFVTTVGSRMRNK